MAELENLKKVLSGSFRANRRNAYRGTMMKNDAHAERVIASERATRIKNGNDRYFNKNKKRIASGDVNEGDVAEAMKRSQREYDANKKVKAAQSKIKTGESLESGRFQRTIGKAAAGSMFKR